MMAAIQIVRFHTKEGIDEAAFAALNERFQREVTPTLPGLVRREATRADDGEWVLILRYTSKEAAQQAGKRDTGDVAMAFMSHIDMSTMSAGFYEIVSE